MKRDYYAGAIMCGIAAFMGFNALGYNIGTIRNIGPGLFPFALSVVLFAVGLLIALNAGEAVADGLDHFDEGASKYPDIKGGIAIIAGMLAFVVLTQTLGIVAGTFACVFVSAIGAKDATWLGSLVLSTVVTVFGIAVFIFLLKLNLPLFQFQGFSL